MDKIADFLIAACELLEAETVLLQENLSRLVSSILFLILGTLFWLGAGVFLLGAVFYYLQQCMSTGQAALICSLAALFLGGICIWYAKRMDKKG